MRAKFVRNNTKEVYEMYTKKSLLVVVCLLLALLVLIAGCASPKPAPTATPVPPTPAVPLPSASSEILAGLASSAPVLFDAQSTGKEYTASYDIGVKSGQVGIVFGYAVNWKDKSSGGHGCALVWLQPGWYPAFRITDGRYEVYNLPVSDPAGWIKVLVEQRAQEQATNYSCPSKTFNDVPVWTSTIPSPPTEPTAPTTARERQPTGVGKTLRFQAGDRVVGYRIVLDNDKKCEGGCRLWDKPATVAGSVTDGVVNPWNTEVTTAKEMEQ